MSLTNAKVGDVIMIWNRWNTHIDTVKKVTPKGTVRTEKSSFRPDGRMIGGDNWNTTKAKIATDKDIQDVKDMNRKSNLYLKFSDFKWSQLSLEKLEQVNNIVTGGRVAPE